MNDCILWKGAIHSSGRYGWRGYKGKSMFAHRAAWIEKNGPIPDGLYVCHKCDNGFCINPDHLFLGTQADNMRDCKEKGRIKTILTNKQVEEIKESTASSNQLALVYPVSAGHIRLIKEGRRRECHQTC